MTVAMAVAALGFTLSPLHLTTPRSHARCATVLLENPLAKIFGGEDKKGKGGPLSTGLDELTKSAPLPVKLAVGLMKPLVGALETAIAEGQEDADMILAEAQSALRMDSRASALLGTDIQIGATFSSASSNMNGAKSMQLQCQVAGSSGSGIVAVRGESDGQGGVRVVQLQLQAGGQLVEVPTLRGGGGGSGGSGSNGVIDVDGVIDV